MQNVLTFIANILSLIPSSWLIGTHNKKPFLNQTYRDTIYSYLQNIFIAKPGAK